MSKLTEWFPIETKPWHIGNYKITFTNGIEAMARFKGKNWFELGTNTQISVSQIVKWRGRLQLIPANKINDCIAAFEKNHQRKDARVLFRHWVSLNIPVKACRYFHVGEILGANFSKVDKRAFKKMSLRLKPKGAEKVRKSIALFSGKT